MLYPADGDEEELSEYEFDDLDILYKPEPKPGPARGIEIKHGGRSSDLSKTHGEELSSKRKKKVKDRSVAEQDDSSREPLRDTSKHAGSKNAKTGMPLSSVSRANRQSDPEVQKGETDLFVVSEEIDPKDILDEAEPQDDQPAGIRSPKGPACVSETSKSVWAQSSRTFIGDGTHVAGGNASVSSDDRGGCRFAAGRVHRKAETASSKADLRYPLGTRFKKVCQPSLTQFSLHAFRYSQETNSLCRLFPIYRNFQATDSSKER